MFETIRRQRGYREHRRDERGRDDGTAAMPILIGAAMIAAAILLSTFVSALGNRYVGFESPNDDTAWLVDRLTGSVYKCQAPDRGKASCTAEIATGSLGDRPSGSKSGR